MKIRGSVAALFLSFVLAPWVSGQSPKIDRVDPPNWWVSLPDPMLMLHGEGLQGAKFHVRGRGVTIEKSSASENGHWAFLWLKTNHAAAQTIEILATSTQGSTTARYQYEKAAAADAGPRGFSSKDVMYLIMPDRFADGDRSNDEPVPGMSTYDRSKSRGYHGGDLRGITEHLDYLQELGVTTVWTTPVVANNPKGGDYHGYGATDLYAIDPHLGTIAEYRALADGLHQRGMKLVFDAVPNHVGPANVWVKDPPMPDWFHGTLANHIPANGDFNAIVDPHAPPRDAKAALDGWFANILPDMNQENPVVAKYLTDNMMWWVQAIGLDGLRIDTFPYIRRPFWQQYLSTLHAAFPRISTVGEIMNPDATVVSYFAGGAEHEGVDTRLDTPFDYPVYFALRGVLVGGKDMTYLADVLRQDTLYPHPERLTPFLGNHDVMRFMSEKGASVALLKMGFGLLLTMRGMPQIYAGDEIAMPGGEDPDNRRDFPGGFPGDKQNAFMASGRTAEQKDVHDWVAALAKLRAAHAVLQTGVQQNLFADATGFAFVRSMTMDGCRAGDHADAAERVLVVANRSAAKRTIAVATAGTVLAGCGSVMGAMDGRADGVAVMVAGKTSVEVEPYSVAAFLVR